MENIYKKNIRILLFILCILLPAVNQAQLKNAANRKEMPSHPRILLLKGEEEGIRKNIQSEPAWAKVHQAVLNECDRMLTRPPLERIKTGRRLLSVSREAIHRIFYLSYAYRMTHENKYLQKAKTELLTISNFSDWNPSHFLDVAEMTIAASIGYDWLYDQLSANDRQIVREAILQKGIDPSFINENNSFLRVINNWNQVCNAGMTFGALAVYDEMPGLAKTVIDRAVETIHLPMGAYAPDGAYPEGYGYWNYGTSLNILFLSALEKSIGTDMNLSALPGFLNTAGYYENMTSPSGYCFNYSDCGLRGDLTPAMFWLASRQNDLSLLWQEQAYLTGDRKEYTGDRLLPALLIWGSGIRIQDIHPPKKLQWIGNGITPVALMRTSWTDPKALFVGFKGGTASSNHSHMDVGSFVMEAGGVRWASDFGAQDYNSLESKGLNIWSMAQNSERWQVFRYNNFVHNTLTINNELHLVKGKANIDSYSDKPDFMNAVSDISSVFEGQLKSCIRGIAIVNQSYVVVRDEIKTPDKPATVRWTMLTMANARITGKNTIELKKDGKKLTLQVTSPANIRMKTWTTVSPHEYDALNPGSILVGFETDVPANTSTALTVLLIPQDAKQVNRIVLQLNDWQK